MGARLVAVLAGIVSGLVVVLLLSPTGGIDTDPPVCYARFGYAVPCGSWWLAAALATGLLVGWIVGAVARRAATR